MSLIRYRDLSMLYRRRKRMSEWVQEQARLATLDMVQTSVRELRLALFSATGEGVPFTLGDVDRIVSSSAEGLRQAAERSWRMGFHDASDSRSSEMMLEAGRAADLFVRDKVERLTVELHSRVTEGFKQGLQDGMDKDRARAAASRRLFLIGPLTASGKSYYEASEMIDAIFVEVATGVPHDMFMAMDWEDKSKLVDGAMQQAEGRDATEEQQEIYEWYSQAMEDYENEVPFEFSWGGSPWEIAESWDGSPDLPMDIAANSPEPARDWQVLADTIGRESAVYLLNEGLYSAFRMEGAKVKMWVATLDERVRWNHEYMHGVCIDVDVAFEMPASQGTGWSYVHMKYPGHCAGPAYFGCPPGDVYNCRCTMVAGESCEELQSLFDSLSPDQITIAAEASAVMERTPSTFREWQDAGFVPAGADRLEYLVDSANSRSARDSKWRQFLRENFPRWSTSDGVSRRTLASLFEYMSGQTRSMQSVLRPGWISPLNDAERARVKSNVADLMRLFTDRSMPTSMRLFRGIDLESLGDQFRRQGIDLRDVARNPIGMEWVDHGFSSATPDGSLALDFASSRFGADYEIVLNVIVPQGFPAIPMAIYRDLAEADPIFFGQHGTGFDELEVLLPPGTRFRVVDVETVDLAVGRPRQVWTVEVALDDVGMDEYLAFSDERNFPEDSFDRSTFSGMWEGQSGLEHPNKPGNEYLDPVSYEYTYDLRGITLPGEEYPLGAREDPMYDGR